MNGQKIKHNIYKNAAASMCFLAGRLIFFKTLNPFVTAYLSVFLGTHTFWAAFIFSLLGLLTISNKIYIQRYIYTIFIMLAVHTAASFAKHKISPLQKAVIGGICLFWGGSIYAAAQWFSPYYFTVAVVEGILTCFLSVVLYGGVRLIMLEQNVKTVTNEEALSLAVLAAGILPGTQGIYLFSVPLSAAAAVLIILETIKRSGTAAGIAAAGLTGIFMFFTGMYRCQLLPMLIMGAAGAAIFKKNKILLPVGFSAGAFPTAFFVYRDLAEPQYAAAVAAAGIASVFIPKRLYLAISGNVSTCLTQSETRALQLQHLYAKRLKEFSAVFKRLSKLTSKNTEAPDWQNDMVMSVKNRVCAACRMQPLCSRSDGSVDIIIEDLLKNVRNGARPLFDTLPPDFSKNCLRVHELCRCAERVYDSGMINAYWRARFDSSRRLMSAQLKNAADIMDRLCGDMQMQLNRDEEKSAALYDKLCTMGAVGVSVCTGTAEEAFVTLNFAADDSGCEKICIAAADVLKKDFAVQSCDIDRHGGITQLRITERPKYRIAAFTADMAKNDNDVSGDCYTYMQLDKGRYLLALADGMGSGEPAREESAASIEMYEDFMEAGFDRELALEIINSILLLNDSGVEGSERFSTLDICTVDLYTGKAEFIKVGAVSTFIIRSGIIERIRSATLPVGILSSVDVDIFEKRLQCNDIILMMTDGVTDCVGDIPGCEERLISMISGLNSTNPRTIAEAVLNMASSSSITGIRDDMTVLAAKIY